MQCDVAIYGTGAAGLWIANRLQSVGARILIFEEASIGGGQTINSQGVIHTGAKYLQPGGKQFAAAGQLWKRAFVGQSSVDLRAVTVLSEYQHILTQSGPFGLRRRIMEVFLRRRGIELATPMDASELARLPCRSDFGVVRVSERTICAVSLVRELSRPVAGKIIPGRLLGFTDTEKPSAWRSIVEINGRLRKVDAGAHVCAMGHGNSKFLHHARIDDVELRTRTFCQLVISGNLPEFFGVAVSSRGLPTIVVTSHHAPNRGGNVWYVGGRLAEQPLELLSSTELHAHVGRELEMAGFDINWPACHPTIHRVRHTEAGMGGLEWRLGLRNRGPLLRTAGNIHFAWPNKLACAPLLAEQVAAVLNSGTGKLTAYPKVQPHETRDLRIRTLPPWLSGLAVQDPST